MQKKQVHCYDRITKKYVKSYIGIRSVSRKFDIPNTTLLDAIKYKRAAGGLLWSYLKSEYYPSEVNPKTGEINFNNSEVKQKPLVNSPVKETNSKISPILLKIQEAYSPSELQAIANGCKILPSVLKTPNVNFDGEHIRIGVLGDTHLGSSYTSEFNIYKAFEEFKRANVDFVVHSGDVTEGMSNRPGHIYELSHLGYDKMKNHAIDVLSQCPAPAYYIDGNHDRWFIKSNGAMIVKDICDAIPNATFLGHDEGDIKLKSNTTLRLWHGEDGNSYATSYRIQKVVESLSGGEKPNILLLGHTHKQAYIFERNIQCVSTGCMQYQTPWMRGKRISAHTGFHIIDVWINSKGVSRFGLQWFPIYSESIE